MTKQMKMILAAMLMAGVASAQQPLSTTTKTEKVAPGVTKTTVVTKEEGAAGSTATGKPSRKGTKKRATRKPVAKKPAEESTISRELRELREKQAAQQAEIDALTQQNATASAQLQQANAAAAAAQQTAQQATSAEQSVAATVDQNKSDVEALKSNVTDLQTINTGLATTISANKQEINDKVDSPTTIHYKGVTITPVAFFALEGVYRQRSVNSDINTPFNNIPLPAATEGHVSELNFSGRQSRLGGLFEGNAGKYKLSGYFETDFLGVGTASNNNQSNSYVLRQRQIWGQAATTSGFTFTGGQMWSLVTENGKGTDNRTEKLPNTIDPQYMVGFSWARQPALRFQQRFGDYKTGAMTLAVSIEQAQITNFTVASSVAGAVPTNFFFSGIGQNGGLYNAAGNIGNNNTAGTGGITNYANNVAPDGVVKAAFDGKYGHVEIGGLTRFLRDYYFPIATVTAASPTSAVTYTYSPNYVHHTNIAGGVFASARGSFGKYADVALAGMAGTGTGRYGSSQLADATLRPDGTLEPIKNYHGQFSLETHPAPKLDVFAYYGGEYAKRTVYTIASGALIGYGVPTLSNAGCYNLPLITGVNAGGTAGSIASTGTCQSPTKYIQEGMIGFTYRIVNTPRFGRLQYSATYSLLQRQLWAGIGSTTTPVSPRAQDGMVHIGMRYYIP